jgi:tetratricopeptide (TPR) repeat protein
MGITRLMLTFCIAACKRTAHLVCLAGVLALALPAHGQDYRRSYKLARDFFDQGKFSIAMEAFEPLIIYDKDNPYVEYASFYYGVSALHQGYHAVSQNMFYQVRKLYPDWSQMHEVNFWLAKSYFDQGELFQALHVLAEINPVMLADQKFRDDISMMKRYYLRKVDDPEILRMAGENHPNDAEVGRALAALLGKELYDSATRHEFDSILVRFNFPKTDFEVDEGAKTVMKDRYTVSLLFPFLATTITPVPNANRLNQSVLDIYNGMRMAVDTLSGMGIQIDLRCYDTDRNNLEAVKKILAAPELKNSDLLVGPLFAEETKLVQQFSAENRIVMMNPISNSLDYIRNNPYAYLFQASHQTLGERSAEVADAATKNKNCIVYFGDAPKDSIMAFSFMKRAQELGMKIVLAEEHRKETAASILTTLATPTEFDEHKNPKQFSLPLDSIGSIYVASDNALIYSKVHSGLTARGDSVVVIGNESWMSAENTATSYENYERLHILLASGNFASLRNPYSIRFLRDYLARHGTYPSLYARLGYEFMLFAGHALHLYGNFFLPDLKAKGFSKGYMFEGYDFTDKQDNQYVPFVYFRHGELTVFNKKY